MTTPKPIGRVLVVEDDLALLAMHTRVLKREGYAVVPASRGRDALSHVRASTFDALVTAFDVPDMDGPELVERVRRIDRDVPVILISGVTIAKLCTLVHDAMAARGRAA